MACGLCHECLFYFLSFSNRRFMSCFFRSKGHHKKDDDDDEPAASRLASWRDNLKFILSGKLSQILLFHRVVRFLVSTKPTAHPFYHLYFHIFEVLSLLVAVSALFVAASLYIFYFYLSSPEIDVRHDSDISIIPFF